MCRMREKPFRSTFSEIWHVTSKHIHQNATIKKEDMVIRTVLKNQYWDTVTAKHWHFFCLPILVQVDYFNKSILSLGSFSFNLSGHSIDFACMRVYVHASHVYIICWAYEHWCVSLFFCCFHSILILCSIKILCEVIGFSIFSCISQLFVGFPVLIIP